LGAMKNVNNQKSKSEYIQWLWGWVHFGTSIFKLHELRLLPTDLNKGNVIYSTEGNVVMIDCGGIDRIDFPKDWKKIPSGLMSLLRWTDLDETAAFRFGYLHYGGSIAEKVFQVFRCAKGLNSFRESNKYCYKPFVDEKTDDLSYIEELNLHWITLRGKLRYGDLYKGRLELQHYYQWRSERDNTVFECESDLLKANEQHYLKHLVCALFHQNVHELITALLNLEGHYYKLYEFTKGLGITLLCKRYINMFDLELPAQALSQIDNDEEIASSIVPVIEIEIINEIIKKNNIFEILWNLDDLENGEIIKIEETCGNLANTNPRP
jgi:hypothetical protein